MTSLRLSFIFISFEMYPLKPQWTDWVPQMQIDNKNQPNPPYHLSKNVNRQDK